MSIPWDEEQMIRREEKYRAMHEYILYLEQYNDTLKKLVTKPGLVERFFNWVLRSR